MSKTIEQLRESDEQLEWIKKAIGVEGANRTKLFGRIHVLNSHAHGYNAYVYTYKCDDKQGRIANLTAALKAIADNPNDSLAVSATANTALLELAEHIKKANQPTT